jgi:hypothetical protein
VTEALREAKLAALGRGAPPGEWAGFSVVGDPLATVALVPPARAPLGLRLAAGLLLGLGAGGYWAVRRRGRSSERAAPGPVAPTHH